MSSSFSYLQTLRSGDLCIQFESRGQYTSPYAVAYTLYEVDPDGGLIQRNGPRQAVKDRTGLYHVVGHAGEGGQPGRWLVRWEWQMTFGGPVECREESFSVVDRASDPNDHLPRSNKRGWS